MAAAAQTSPGPRLVQNVASRPFADSVVAGAACFPLFTYLGPMRMVGRRRTYFKPTRRQRASRQR